MQFPVQYWVIHRGSTFFDRSRFSNMIFIHTFDIYEIDINKTWGRLLLCVRMASNNRRGSTISSGLVTFYNDFKVQINLVCNKYLLSWDTKLAPTSTAEQNLDFNVLMFVLFIILYECRELSIHTVTVFVVNQFDWFFNRTNLCFCVFSPGGGKPCELKWVKTLPTLMTQIPKTGTLGSQALFSLTLIEDSPHIPSRRFMIVSLEYNC